MISQQLFHVQFDYLSRKFKNIFFVNHEITRFIRPTVNSDGKMDIMAVDTPIERQITIIADKENPMYARLVVWNKPSTQDNSMSEYDLSKEDAESLLKTIGFADSINAAAYKVLQFSQSRFFVVVNFSLLKMPSASQTHTPLFTLSQKLQAPLKFQVPIKLQPQPKLQTPQSSIEKKTQGDTQNGSHSNHGSEIKLNKEFIEKIQELKALLKILKEDWSSICQAAMGKVIELALSTKQDDIEKFDEILSEGNPQNAKVGDLLEAVKTILIKDCSSDAFKIALKEVENLKDHLTQFKKESLTFLGFDQNKSQEMMQRYDQVTTTLNEVLKLSNFGNGPNRIAL